MDDAPASMRWCLSRHGPAICTRPIGHAGLHNRAGTSLMWSDREADPALCPASGMPAVAAAESADGFPHGRALCPTCLAFVRLTDDGRLWNHDSFRGTRSEAESAQRAEWFNSHGWDDPDASALQ
ncbi:hypothetical protein [Microbacterium pumilum]|uniref:Uncharacterized protein n=1 Tax=Microbacterium pumilum TaxID=344165 RepID=A0ABN2SWJ4_9MICO